MSSNKRSSGTAVVILAAGKGTRMKSDLPKVLHLLHGKPLVRHVVEAARKLHPDKTVVVVGYKGELVKDALGGLGLLFAEQKEQLGTAHAVSCAKETLKGFTGTVVVLSGDVPLIDPEAVKELADSGESVALLTAETGDPSGYGRVIRSANGSVAAIVEEKDATSEQKKVNEINAGVYAFDSAFLFRAIEMVRPDNAQKEFYLTDLVRIALADGRTVKAYKAADFRSVTGVNRPEELEALHGPESR